jgi:hypothetical protein
MIEPTNWWKTKVVMFIAKHTPKCHDITPLISQSLDGPLPLRTRIEMKFHYLICVWCERYRDQLGFLRKALPSCPGHTAGKLPSATRARLKVAIRSEG